MAKSRNDNVVGKKADAGPPKLLAREKAPAAKVMKAGAAAPGGGGSPARGVKSKQALGKQAERTRAAGSRWLQLPGIEHTVLDYSADCEVLEIVVPADFGTEELG